MIELVKLSIKLLKKFVKRHFDVIFDERFHEIFTGRLRKTIRNLSAIREEVTYGFS